MPDPSPEPHNFSAPTTTLDFAALLFDFDGTILQSTPAIVKFWMGLGKEIGVPGEKILETSHGRRTMDVLSILCPERANWEYVCEAEGSIPRDHGQDATEIPGARALLEQLESVRARWAIVTSGTKNLVHGWLNVMKLAHPKFMVTAEDVKQGKPDPACYRLGAERLGFEGEYNDSEMLVLEDAPAGVQAGKAAGFKVVGLATTHSVKQLVDAGADWIVEDMRSVTMTKFDETSGRIGIQIKDALVL